jgi:hypothetical protein
VTLKANYRFEIVSEIVGAIQRRKKEAESGAILLMTVTAMCDVKTLAFYIVLLEFR